MAKQSVRGAMVVNCNPMTLGHKYLIDTALKKVDDLLVFVVEEDSSIFPFMDRFNIVKEELKDYKNIIVIKGGPYIISRGTFPTYFIKKKDEMLDIYTELDGSIFAKKIAQDLEIDIRFFGEEPIDIVTLNYNNTLKRILEDSSINVEIIRRKQLDNTIISASYVRNLIKVDKIEEAYKFLPNATIKYLQSNNGQIVVKKIMDF
jgi:[citrate (pro-3S)-lyase] ligase